MNSIHDIHRLIDDGEVNIGTVQNKMKALSIRQPWAWTILHAGKDIENRTWRTEFRGGVLIHASSNMDDRGFEYIKNTCFGGIQIPRNRDLPVGGIVGYVEIVDVVSTVEEYPSPWFQGPYGFVLEKPMPLTFKRIKGQLGFFDVNIGC